MRTFDVYRLLAARAARESARKRSASRRLGQVSIILGAGLTLAALMLVLIGMLAFASISDRLPPVANLETFYAGENPVLLTPTRIYDRSGQHLLYTFENPDAPLAYRPISGEGGISPWMSELTVAVEDPAYWRSMWITPTALTREEAQTIPEQLVDSLLLWDAAPDFPLPLQRAILVAQMMTRYSREQVLEWYLNSVDYGHLAYGVEEAARLYLDKGADELNLAESALLIGVSQTPSLNPLDAPAAALENKDAVLAQLRQEGWITRLQYEDAAAAEIVFRAEAAASEPAAPAFINALIDQLAAEVPLQRIERGGLVIWSTLDFAAQQELTCATRVQLERIVGMENDDYLEVEGCRAARLLPTLPPGSADAYSGLLGAGLIIDPRSGEVLAYQDPFSVLNKNSSAVTYQPGSLLTPLAALTSFTRSYGPGSLVWDVPGNEPAVLAPYISADADYLGPMRLRKAIANDYVMVIAELMETLGAQDVFELSAKLG
ncbi:MAG: penicillin-binding protein, partial [Anaerolineaceae bacterium]|nr:penicillin-binding protein [Anaerolineaceae bacterium]